MLMPLRCGVNQSPDMTLPLMAPDSTNKADVSEAGSRIDDAITTSSFRHTVPSSNLMISLRNIKSSDD